MAKLAADDATKNEPSPMYAVARTASPVETPPSVSSNSSSLNSIILILLYVYVILIACGILQALIRLCLRNTFDDRLDQKELHNYPKSSKPKSKASGKNKKSPNKHPNVVKKLTDFFLAGKNFSLRYERLLQEIFALIAIVPSIELGLIPTENLTVSGDGTCVHCHSSSIGSKVCDCHKNGIYNCKCDRKYSDIDATYGWDFLPNFP